MPINAEPVDLDGDGDLDVVAGSRLEGRVLWYENQGALQFAEHRIDFAAPVIRTDGFNMDYADLDGDGRKDIVSVAAGSRLIWLQQPAEPQRPWAQHVIGTLAPDQLISVRLADIDGDGDLDAFCGSYSAGPRDHDGPEVGADAPLGRIAWFENPGAEPRSNWRRHDIVRRKRGMFDKWEVRDLDADGDLDFVGTRGNSYPYDGVFWLEQIRRVPEEPVFRQARDIDSEWVPVPD